MERNNRLKKEARKKELVHELDRIINALKKDKEIKLKAGSSLFSNSFFFHGFNILKQFSISNPPHKNPFDRPIHTRPLTHALPDSRSDFLPANRSLEGDLSMPLPEG